MAAICHETKSRSGDWPESGSNMQIACVSFLKGLGFGSAFWWVLLSLGAGWLGKKSGPRLPHGINIIAGLSILTFGLHTLGSLPYCETRSNALDLALSIADFEKVNARV